MRSIFKTSTLERQFPLLAVENDCIVSKNADITLAFRVHLPEIFTISGEEYESLHATWIKALRVLPDFTVVHKQDFFIEQRYEADTGDSSFLSRNFELHFNERPFLSHSCYLYITKTTHERSRRQSNFSTLCRGYLLPKEIRDPDTIARFRDAVEQAVSILNESGLIRLERLTDHEITGTEDRPGLLNRYFSLSQRPIPVLEDIRFDPAEVRIGDRIVCLHTLSDLDLLPQEVGTDSRYERLSTDRTDCRLSFAAPAGLLLGCNHIYNQYIFIDSHDEILRQFEKSARNMTSLSRYSRANAVNREWIELYLNEAHTQNLTAVRCHCNVLAWADTPEELKRIKNEVGAQLTLMGCTPHHNTVDVPVIYWAGIPGNAADFPAEETFYTFFQQALCFFSAETNYHNSLSPFGIKLVDRLTGIPLHVDLSDLPMKKGIITNRNRVIIGPSGSGKSFFTNHMIRQYYEQGAHVVLVDMGNSYQGLCELIREKTHGEDGVYITYTEQCPITFNPFYSADGTYDIEKKESIKMLILSLWKRENELPSRAEEVALSNAVNLYLSSIRIAGAEKPSFNAFYDFIRKDYRIVLRQKNVREKDFDIDNFLNTLEPYYRDGEYGYLLNSDQELDLLHKRFVVFELDNIRDHKILLTVTTLIIIEMFINKMRRLKGVRKVFLVEECWKALMTPNMSEYIRYLFKTSRKYFGDTVVISQEIDDIVSSPIVRETIVNNSDCRILLDQKKYLNKFDAIQSMLGLTEKEKAQILSINQNNHPNRNYKEVWIGLGGVQSAVYAVEVSPQEYFTYTTEESEKTEVLALAEQLDGNLEQAIRRIAASKNENKNL